MANQKILDLLNKASDLKFLTRNRNIVNNQSNANYDLGNEINYNIKVLKSNLCHNNHTYILVRSDIACIKHNVAYAAFKNCAISIKCIPKIYATTVDDGEDLDLVMSMYNLLEYILIYLDTTGSLWFCSKDE